ncbi:MAG: hypothetical protein WCK89_14125 [bacterium]
MKKILSLVSWLILAGMLASALLCAGKTLSGEANRVILLAGTILWFGTAPLWMKRT